MAQSDGAEQAMDVNIQEGATQSEREEIGSSGPTDSPNAGSLGSMKEAVSRSSSPLPCNPEGRPAEQGEGDCPSARHEATHCLLSLRGGCWV